MNFKTLYCVVTVKSGLVIRRGFEHWRSAWSFAQAADDGHFDEEGGLRVEGYRLLL